MAGEIFVIVEHIKGNITDVTYELLGMGRELSSKTGSPLKAVILGKDVKGLADQLGYADGVITMEHELLENANIETWSYGLEKIIGEKNPEMLLMGSTNSLMGLSSYLSEKMNIPFINLCETVKIDDSEITGKVLLYGGKIEGDVRPKAKPVLVSVRPGNYPADDAKVEKEVPVESVAPPDTLADAKMKFKAYIEPEAEDVDLTVCDVLISIGRGIQGADNIEQAEELAGLFENAAVGASRPVIDQGWLPMMRQVGKSGVTVKPKLYVAMGISGAPEHIEGMKNADMIVAINTDAKAPIFNFATYGIEEDLFDIVPLLIEELEK